jgi:hypothetical protein
VPPNVIPEKWIDHDLCPHAVKHDPYLIGKTPAKYRDDAVNLTALAFGSGHFIGNEIPPYYHTPDMLCRALDIRFDLIQNIHGKHVGAEVFAHAGESCPDATLWEKPLVEHGRDFRKYPEVPDCAKHCWSVFVVR